MAFLIPEVGGYVLEDVPADDVFGTSTRCRGSSNITRSSGPTTGLRSDGLSYASGNGTVSPIDTYIEQVFSEGIQLPRDDAPMPGDRTLVVTNEADVAWAGLGGAAVIAATVPGSDAARWAWTNNDLLWVVGDRSPPRSTRWLC